MQHIMGIKIGLFRSRT